MATYNVELTRQSIDGHLEYKKKFNMKGDIGSSGGGALVVNATEVDNDLICDKTAGEMAAAYLSGGVIICTDGIYFNNIVFAQGLTDEEGYSFATYQGDVYDAATASDYPICQLIT